MNIGVSVLHLYYYECIMIKWKKKKLSTAQRRQIIFIIFKLKASNLTKCAFIVCCVPFDVWYDLCELWCCCCWLFCMRASWLHSLFVIHFTRITNRSHSKLWKERIFIRSDIGRLRGMMTRAPHSNFTILFLSNEQKIKWKKKNIKIYLFIDRK